MNPTIDSGTTMHEWVTDLFPICRSLTGTGVRETLSYLDGLLPKLNTYEIASGSQVLDWIVPDEWNIHDAYIADLDGNRIIDFKASNLHVVGYSEPIDDILTREALESHLHSLPQQPTAIPYVTSYYNRTWGFCLSENQRSSLGPGPFRVRIDSTIQPGHLTYADLVLPGASDREIAFSTYICHPSMANNELSGPVVTTALARYVAALPARKYTYRFMFLPETIGAIAYLSQHLKHMKEHVVAGWQVTCVGDDRAYSFLPSRAGETLADRVSQRVLDNKRINFDTYSFLNRGSDERQWCAPGVDLPFCSIMRSKYGTYPEYHTSLDDLKLVTPNGLQGAADALVACIQDLEKHPRWRAVSSGEPQLGRRGLYPTMSKIGSSSSVVPMMNVLAYCDGTYDAGELAEIVGNTSDQVGEILLRLEATGLITDT